MLALKKGGGGPKSPFPRGAVSLDRTKYQQYDADLTAVFALSALEAQRIADVYWPEGEKYPVNYESNGAPGGRDFSNNRNGGKKSGGGGGTAHKSERAQTHRVASQEDDECDEDVDYDDDIDYVSHRGGRFLRPFLHRLLRPRTRGAGVAGGSKARSDPFTDDTPAAPAAKAFGNELSSDSDGDGPEAEEGGDGGGDDDAGAGDALPPPRPRPTWHWLGIGV